MNKRIFTLFSLFSLTFVSAQQNAFFLSNPSLSPDAKTAYFSFEGDIWKVDAHGGNASRITALQGEAINPRVSPDGKWLAFSSNQYGNYDVFVMPINGGTIKQLTFHQGKDEMESWGWDSETIYYTSNQNNNFGSFKTNLEGKTPQPLFNHYFNTTNGLVETPKGELIFTNSSESANQVTRKRYKGENNPDLLAYNPKSKKFKQYTDYNGKDFNATVDKNGIIYFISDENNGEYNLYKIENGIKTAITKFDSSIKKPFVAANGSKVIFEKDYQLFVYDVGTKNASPISVNVNSNAFLTKEQSFQVEDEISNFDVSPDGKKLAFISRGIVFVSDIEGKFINQITNGKERALEVKWLKDNKNLIFNQTDNGYQNWFKIAANGKGNTEQLTHDLRNNRDITFNNDLTEAVYLSGRDEVRLLNLETFKSKTIVKDEIWAFQNSAPSFSPNGEYVMFSAKRNFEMDIFIYNIKKNEAINLTKTSVTEQDPFWSPNGKYIYFTSDRTNPSYPLGLQNPSVYRLALDWFDTPYKSDQFDKLFAEEKKEEKKEGIVNIDSTSINLDGLLERVELVSERFGNQQNPYVFEDGKKEYVFYNSNQENGRYQLYRKTYIDFDETKTEKVFNRFVNQIMYKDKSVYFLSGGNIYKTSLSGTSPDQIKIKYTFTKNLSDEFNQMFEEAWAGVEENFYDENFHGLNWKAKKDQYAKYLPYVNNRNDLRILLNDMLGELNASHLGFSSSGNEENKKLYYFSNETGIIFKKDSPFEVERVVRKSPAFIKTVDVQTGDVLQAVNGVKIDTSKNRDMYFSTPKKVDELVLDFDRNGTLITTKVHPISNFELKNLLYDEWIFENKNRVNEWSKNRIAYSYMKNMGSSELETFLLDMVAQENHKEGLILDLRFNTGGNVHDKVLNFLAQRPYLQWKYREGQFTVQPNFAPSAKPIVLLINEYSLSDAEMTAAGFKALQLGKIIGQETYRWIIFTSGKNLVDGSFYRVPAWGTYTLDGANLEKTGVAPDIYIKNTFLDRQENKDPQLERAVKEILKELK